MMLTCVPAGAVVEHGFWVHGPSRSGALVTLRSGCSTVNGCGCDEAALVAANAAVTPASAPPLSTQLAVPYCVHGPPHPRNAAPPAGTGLSVIVLDPGRVDTQLSPLCPQSMPFGELDTSPGPETVSSRVLDLTKLTLTCAFAPGGMAQIGASPLHPCCHPGKL